MSRTQRVVLDTSILIGHETWAYGADVEAGISVASIAELRFGVLVTDDDEDRAARLSHLSRVQQAFSPLAMDEAVSDAYGHFAALTVRGGRQPRNRQFDLVIAATAKAHDAALVTANAADVSHLSNHLQIIAVDTPR